MHVNVVKCDVVLYLTLFSSSVKKKTKKKTGSFSEHLDQLTPRGEGLESPDSTSHTSADQGAQSNSLRPESAAEKTGAVAKVPKSVSTGALSLMIPGGKSKNSMQKEMHTLTEKYDLKQFC